MESVSPVEIRRGERAFALLLCCALLGFAGWGVSVGWKSRALPGNGFRQTQTAITAMFVQRDHDFSFAYPTPVLGKPWSVPFEFPLYQWTVAVVSDATGLSLIKCGRLVSAVCFFLGLPAVWLLLGRMGVPWVRRVLVLGMVLTCPLQIFYARAFLIETMALMFSLWFLQAFVAAVEKRSCLWLVVANVAGIGAGLVKVTTFLVYLVPAGLWALWQLRGAWREQGVAGPRRWLALARPAAWVGAAVIMPFTATYAWILFSDRTKALNPGARGLVSSKLHGYNFGRWSDRMDPAIWGSHWRTFSTEILPTGTMAILVVVVLLFCRGRRLAWVAGCAGLFLLAPVVFPVLYAWHEYYFAAVAVLPMVAVGTALDGLFEANLPRWRAWAVAVIVIGFQMHTYLAHHRPLQLEEPRGSNDLAEALRYTTQPDDVLIIAGEDWGSMTPFYAQRRALMLRRAMETTWPYVDESFANLAGEPVAALVLRGAQRENRQLLERATASFGIDPAPVYSCRDALVFVPTERVSTVMVRLTQLDLEEISPCRSTVPSPPEGGVLWEAPNLTDRQQRAFTPIGLSPLRYSCQFGVGIGNLDGRPCTSAHPTTRIWFPSPPGRHQVTVEFAIARGAFDELRREDATDGVEFVVSAARGHEGRRVLFSRLLRPFDEPEDRGWQREEIPVEFSPGEELLIETLPGPQNNANRDWASWGRIEIH